MTSQGTQQLCVRLDTGRCTGLGICESLAPDYFEVGDDGDLVLLQTVVSDADRDAVEQAVASCPTEALRLEG